MKQKIGIIGGGFAGTMTAVQLVLQSDTFEKNQLKNDLEIFIINQKQSFNKGIAYNSYSDEHILNVSTIKMSAFPDKPTHFLDWVLKKEEFKKYDYDWLANAYLPRKLYGEYLSKIWEETTKKATRRGRAKKTADESEIAAEKISEAAPVAIVEKAPGAKSEKKTDKNLDNSNDSTNDEADKK